MQSTLKRFTHTIQSHYVNLSKETINELIVTEHGIAYEKHVRLPNCKDKQTTQKPNYNDTKASVLQSRALSFQWYNALDYSRRRDELNTKYFVLMHQQIYRKKSISESRWSKLSLKFTVTYMKKEIPLLNTAVPFYKNNGGGI